MRIMKNPYYYLFYRLNILFNKNGENEWGPIGLISFFTGQYISIIYDQLISIIGISFSQNTLVVIGIFIAVFILNSSLFLNSNRVHKINESFQKESLIQKRLMGFVIVLLIIFPVIWMFI